MKPSLPKGTRDFGPEQIYKRSFIFDTIRTVFERFGYAPIETPSMENLQTLTGKYGEEGDQLLFKVLNNGQFLDKAPEDLLRQKNSAELLPHISKRGLRYDLTVPFARYVVMHQHEVQFPFKRYQIQPVWRADRPQKGRYQEFYQCDADVVGSNSLLYEAEFAQIYATVFRQLGLDAEIRINHRRILQGLAEAAGAGDRFAGMTMAIDKLDKVGTDGVDRELERAGIDTGGRSFILDFLAETDTDRRRAMIAGSEHGAAGLEEIDRVTGYLEGDTALEALVWDPTLARGLSYYTGCIFEVKAKGVEMGSIGGGGRYDNLTGVFGMPGVPGVGISFGAERIYDVMETLELFPRELSKIPAVIFLAFDDASLRYAFRRASELREAGVPVDVYPEPGKMKKQFKYAGDRGYRYAVVCGETEMARNQVAVKDLASGEQQMMSPGELEKMLTSC